MNSTSWTRQTAVTAVLALYPTPISSHVYANTHLARSERIPTYQELRTLFGTWSEIKAIIWKEPTIEWEEASARQAVLAFAPTPLYIKDYQALLKKHPNDLPSPYHLYQLFGPKWLDVKEALYGVSRPKPWTTKRLGEWMPSTFPKRPTYQAYLDAQRNHPDYPSVSVFTRLYPGWNEAMTQIYGRDSLYRPNKQYKRYTVETLTALIRQHFEAPPGSTAYRQMAEHSKFLPNIKTLVKEFGSYQSAMNAIYPDVAKVRAYRGKWQEADFLRAIEDAYEALGEGLTQKTYHQWRDGREAYPSLRSLLTYAQGDFASLVKPFNVQVVQQSSFTEEEVTTALRDYLALNPSRSFPKLQDYVDLRAAHHPEWPSLYWIRSYFKTWREAIQAIGPDLRQAKPYQIKAMTQEAALASLRAVHAQIGDPLTKGRYDAFVSEVDDGSYLSSYSIKKWFPSWNQALLSAAIKPLRKNMAQAELQQQLKELDPQAPLSSLQDFFSHYLEE